LSFALVLQVADVDFLLGIRRVLSGIKLNGKFVSELIFLIILPYQKIDVDMPVTVCFFESRMLLLGNLQEFGQVNRPGYHFSHSYRSFVTLAAFSAASVNDFTSASICAFSDFTNTATFSANVSPVR